MTEQIEIPFVKCSYCGDIFDVDEVYIHGCFAAFDEYHHELFIDDSRMIKMINNNKKQYVTDEQQNETPEELQEAGKVDSYSIDIDEEPINVKEPNQEQQSHSAPSLESDSYMTSLPTLFPTESSYIGRPLTPLSSASSNSSQSPTPSLAGFSDWVKSLVKSNSSLSDLVQPSTSDDWNEVIRLFVEAMKQNTIMMMMRTDVDYAFAIYITETMKMLPFKKKILLQMKIGQIVNEAVHEHLMNTDQEEQ